MSREQTKRIASQSSQDIDGDSRNWSSESERDRQKDIDMDEPLMSGAGDDSGVVNDQILLKWATAMQSWRTPPGSPSTPRTTQEGEKQGGPGQLSSLRDANGNSNENSKISIEKQRKERKVPMSAQNVPETLRKLVPQGIPGVLRKEVWNRLAGCSEGSIEAGRLKQQYLLLFDRDCAQNHVIERDLHRTFPAHKHFQSEQGQQDLYSICRSYALYDSEVSYSEDVREKSE